MIIVGLNSFWEEDGWRCKGGSVSLIIDGKLVTSIAEDRISRNKYEGGYTKALRYILELHNIKKEDVDYFCISFYGNHLVPDDYVLRFHLHDLQLEDHPEKLVLIPSHHFSHAVAGYFLSPFDEAIIMVADNEGSILYSGNCNNEGAVGAYCERNSYYYAKGNIVTLLDRDFEEPTMVGFGKAYNKFTEYLGLGDYHNGGKTMGLSSYGTVPIELRSVDLWELDEHDHLMSHIKETYDSTRDIECFLNEHNVACPTSHDYTTEFGKNLAYYIQSQLNKWACEKLRRLVEKTGVKNICISGGVAQNGVMNAYIEKELLGKVFVPPFPSDQGQSLGNAIYAWIYVNMLANNSLIPKWSFPNFKYLGSEFSDEQIEEAICFTNLRKQYVVKKSDNIAKDVACIINSGKIIAWFQGKSEYGCRALGSRSIIASPKSADLRDKINILKGRELFRPLAPSVLAEHASEYFDNTTSLLSEYMLGVVDVIPEKRVEIAGVTHIDGTARIQTLTNSQNPLYYQVIDEYYKLSGIPLITNTSYNMAGEPIVETPIDAINSFREMNLDVLACGNYLIEKKENNNE